MSFKKILSTIKSYNDDKDDLLELNDSKYVAFISYSRKDKKIVNDLYKYLEKHFKQKINAEDRKQNVIFIDKLGLNSGEILDEQIENALENSKYLIVICSCNVAKYSFWVDKEIEYFAELGKIENIKPIIINGEPNSNDNECYPNSLKSYLRKNILCANYKEDGKEAFDRILAELENLSYPEFVAKIKREKRIKIFKRTKLWIKIIVIFGILFGIFQLLNYVTNGFFDKMLSYFQNFKDFKRIPTFLTILAIFALFSLVKEFVQTISDLLEDIAKKLKI